MQTTTMNNQKLTTKQMTVISLVTAVTCIIAPFSIPLPFSPVPISFTNLILFLSIYILGTAQATISYLIYLLIGMVGLPVFSGFSGGFGKLAGPTGGYLIGFIFLTLIAGYAIEKSNGRKSLQAAGLILGMLICYAFGTVWLSISAGLTFSAALAAGVLPYLPGDTVKIIIALIIGPVLARTVRRA